MARVSDYLDSVSFYWPLLSARDYPNNVMSLHELDASIRNTEKHIHLISCADKGQAKWAAEMAKVAAQSDERRLARPPVSILTCALSPLSQEAGGLEAGLEFAKAGLPVGLATMPMLGGTAPASVASLLAMGTAELLSAAVFFQLAQPGTKVYCALFSTVMNPYSGGCMSSTNIQALLSAAPVDIFRYYNIPVMSSYGSGDSRELNSWNFGRAVSVDTVFQYMMQPDMFPCFGLMDNDTLCHPEHMLLDDYIYSTIKTLAEGMVVDDACLAIEELAEVGPGGSFMARPFTMKNIRKLWKPSVRHQWDQDKKDFRDIIETAKEQVKWIWANHRPQPLSDAQDRGLSEVLKAAEKELLSN
jgi:trimethylamine--corrinoid protein Co-methyltransferase